MSTNPRTSSKIKTLSTTGQALRTLLHVLWGAGGATLFYKVALPTFIPALVPLLRTWSGTNGYFIVDLIAGFSSVGTDRAPGGPEASSWSPEAAAAKADGASSREASSSEFQLSQVDGDTCSFLFLIFATQLTAVAALGSARISSGIGILRSLFHLAVLIFQPILALFCTSLACNGMIGGVQQGADPMACVATLCLAFLYYFCGGICLLFFVNPFP